MFPLNLGPQARARKADPARLVKGTCWTIVPAPLLHRSPGLAGKRGYRNVCLVWARALFLCPLPITLFQGSPGNAQFSAKASFWGMSLGLVRF